MSNIGDGYEMEAGTSGLLETCDESRILIETVGNMVGENNAVDEKYFVVTTDVDGEQKNLIRITEAEDKLDGDNSIRQNECWAVLCRICANTSDHLIPIFKDEGLEHDFNNKIQRYLPIQVSEEDNLPLQLCYHCAATLLAWHDLVDSCLEAEQRLLQMKNEVQHKNQSKILCESLETGALTTEDAHLLNKNQAPKQELLVKGEQKEESTANDTQRLNGEECTETVLLKPNAEIGKFNYEETLEYFECEECDASFIKILDLVAHLNSEHDDLFHYCSYCDSVYRGNQQDFDKHEKNHNKNVEAENTESTNIVLCTLCNEACNGTPELKQHLSKHVCGEQPSDETESEYYTCNSCLKSFSKKTDLRRHLRLHKSAECVDNDEEMESLNNAKVVTDDRCFYECNTCGKQIVTKRGFIRHIRIHTGNRPCRCNICGNQYRIKQDLARHIRDVHEGIKKCLLEEDEINTSFRNTTNQSIVKEDQFTNEDTIDVTVMYSRERDGEQHEEDSFVLMIPQRKPENPEDRVYGCRTCKIYNLMFNEFSAHVSHHSSDNGDCGEEYESQEALHAAVARSLESNFENFDCEICGSRCDSQSALFEHLEIHTEDRIYTCNFCGDGFSTINTLRSHISFQHAINCKDCKMQFETEQMLQNHLREVHVPRKTISCEICEKAFPNKSSLRHHMISHSNDQPYVCKTCNRAFKRTSSLYMHERAVHQKIKSFLCVICNKKFALKTQMQTHMRVHTGERPYACDICNQTFKTTSQLQLHKDVHFDNRPFPCDHCDKKFRRRPNLILHLRTHTGEKPHLCELCGRGFAQRGDMRKHKATHYKLKTPSATRGCCQSSVSGSCLHV